MRIRNLLVTALAFLAAGAACAQESSISFKSTELVPGLFMLEGVGGFAGGNLGLLTGEDGVVLIDDGIAPISTKVLEAVSNITGASVDFVINTHAHGDHIGGNAALHASGATIVAHDNIRRRMLADPDLGSADALPEITFGNYLTFHLNGHKALVFHVAKAHTDGDAVIHFPDANVIHTGDTLFNGLFPFIDLDSGGSVDGYLAAQEQILALANAETKIIPGHGPLATRSDLVATRDMIIDARKRVKKLMDEGMTLDDIVAANPLASYHDDWNWGFITTERMTRMLHRSMNAPR